VADPIRKHCAEILQLWDADCDVDEAIEHLRGLLAQPEPEGVTDEELYELWNSEGNEADFQDCRRFARAVLTHYARPTIKPVPVAERPWEREGWCDAEGRCWWFNHTRIPEWQLASDGPYGDFSLPHHALPLPKSH
jgi:hypothetical protein